MIADAGHELCLGVDIKKAEGIQPGHLRREVDAWEYWGPRAAAKA